RNSRPCSTDQTLPDSTATPRAEENSPETRPCPSTCERPALRGVRPIGPGPFPHRKRSRRRRPEGAVASSPRGDVPGPQLPPVAAGLARAGVAKKATARSLPRPATRPAALRGKPVLTARDGPPPRLHRASPPTSADRLLAAELW